MAPSGPLDPLLGRSTHKPAYATRPDGSGRLVIGRPVQSISPRYASAFVDEVKMYN